MKQFASGCIFIGLIFIILSNRIAPDAYHPRKVAVVTRSFNTAFQTAVDRDVFVNYTVSIACTISLTAGQSGIAYLETSPDNATWTTVGQVVNTNTGTLTLGLNLTSTNSGNLYGMVPQGYWARIRTSNVTGTPTFSYLIGYETLL
jgi:hypothetical protein